MMWEPWGCWERLMAVEEIWVTILSQIILWNPPGSWSMDCASSDPWRCLGSRFARGGSFPSSTCLGASSSGVVFSILNISSLEPQS